MNIIRSRFTFIIAIVGVIGGLIWAFQSNWQTEPIILIIGSAIEIVAYVTIGESSSVEPAESKSSFVNNNHNTQNVNLNLNLQNAQTTEQTSTTGETERKAILELMKSKTKILFIDDDEKFNVVQILKDTGWKKTKTVVDIKTLDINAVSDANIIFVDINGVGKLLRLEYEGLDLALMLKQKYPTKKVVIYSANKNNNSFHKAWDECDFKLEKNALPYQFQNLVEEYSLELKRTIG